MTIDIPHMILTTIIIFAVIWTLNHLAAVEAMPKKKRALLQFAVLFVALLLLNIAWPYTRST